MAEIVAEAIRAGAAGFSTTRTVLHRAKDGQLAATKVGAMSKSQLTAFIDQQLA
jgi:N-acyl-D-aspartate/D-glutamate deacylase